MIAMQKMFLLWILVPLALILWVMAAGAVMDFFS